MKRSIRKKIKIVLVFLSISLWLGWDLHQAHSNNYNYLSFMSAGLSKADSAASATIAIVTSDDSTLNDPCSRSADPSYQTVEEMVRKAIDLEGGFQGIIKTGMTVLIKPNLVEIQTSGSGNITDVRVVKAIVKIVDEIDHGKIKILVGDGSPRPYTTFEKANSFGKKPWTELYDVAGYQDLKTEMISEGIDFRLTNLNGNSDTNPIPELEEVNVEDGGSAQPQKGKYFIHKDVIDADVYITVPVMKIHDPGITCALKNQIGLAPSSLYGFSKTAGTPSDNYQHKLLHTSQAPYMWTDKEIVDLSAIAKIKFVIVDALMCLDIQKTLKTDNSNQVRMNLIVAGKDPVAADNVCARLMGLNPDDIEHITLAERMGLGTNNPDKIYVAGADINSVKKRFRKNPSVEDQKFGQSNREWILNGTYSIDGITDPINYEFVKDEAELSPSPSKDGWSENTYFINDRINLKDYYAAKQVSADNVVSYAFTYFKAPADMDAELWVGSDEALKIYINGNVVYNYNGTRSFSNAQLVSDIKKITIKKGINRLLVKALQKINTSYYDFSLNICDTESNSYYSGTRVEGLKFTNNVNISGVGNFENEIASSFELLNCYPNPFNPSTKIEYSVPFRTKIKLDVFDLLGRKVAELINEEKNPGIYYINFTASEISSGIYIYRLSYSNKQISKKMVLLR